MKIIIKPIQFELKEDVELDVSDDITINSLAEAVYNKKPELGINLDFMFRGKKLETDKTLKDAGVKEKTKLMVYKSAETKPIPVSNTDLARKELYSQGHDQVLTDKILKTINKIETLSVQEIIDKSLYFLNSFKKEGSY